jgi:hypothetical protein
MFLQSCSDESLFGAWLGTRLIGRVKLRDGRDYCSATRTIRGRSASRLMYLPPAERGAVFASDIKEFVHLPNLQ